MPGHEIESQSKEATHIQAPVLKVVESRERRDPSFGTVGQWHAGGARFAPGMMVVWKNCTEAALDQPRTSELQAALNSALRTGPEGVVRGSIFSSLKLIAEV